MRKRYEIIEENRNGIIFRQCPDCGEFKELNVENFKARNDRGTWKPICRRCLKTTDKETKPNEIIEEIRDGIVFRKCMAECGEFKELNNENYQFRKDTNKWRTECQDCRKKYWHEYNAKNRETIKVKKKEYYQENKEQWIEWRENNPEKVKANNYNYVKKKIKNNMNFKLKLRVSQSVNSALKRRGHSKLRKSTFKHLLYTPQELKEHLESQFEWWMTWDNWGMYNPKTWNDNDSSTWKWNIDHIIPHSEFEYISLEDPLFKECWALSNLRPYSAKQNIIDGARRTKHENNSL